MLQGACLHGLYNAIEAYFLRVAKFFENNIDEAAWHRDLLDRMRLDVPGIRPALITDRILAERIDELRRFHATTLHRPLKENANHAQRPSPCHCSSS